MCWGHCPAQLGASPSTVPRQGEDTGSWEKQLARVQGEDMVKSELGASFPLAPCREEEWGGGMGRFPPAAQAQPSLHIRGTARWEQGPQGPPRDTGSPSAAPGKALGWQKEGASEDKAAVASALPTRSCS